MLRCCACCLFVVNFLLHSGKQENAGIVFVGGNVGTILVPAIAFGWPLFYAEWEQSYTRVFFKEVLTIIFNHKTEGEGDIYKWLEGMLCVYVDCYKFLLITNT